MSETLPALSLHQPWATLMVLPGELRKRHETRSRGFWQLNAPRLQPGELLAIHATKDKAEGLPFFVRSLPARDALAAINIFRFEALPFGAVVGIVRFVAAHPIDPEYARQQSENDLAFGYWLSTRVALETELVLRLEDPDPARGLQGIWRWEIPWPLSERLAPLLEKNQPLEEATEPRNSKQQGSKP